MIFFSDNWFSRKLIKYVILVRNKEIFHSINFFESYNYDYFLKMKSSAVI